MYHDPVPTLRNQLVAENDGTKKYTLHSDIKRLADFGTPEGNLDEIIKRVQDYAIKITGADDLVEAKEPIDKDMVEKTREIIREELKLWISYFILDEHREAVVRYHARGFSTSQAITNLMIEDEMMFRLSHENTMGQQGLRDILVPRMAYLKPGNPRWPEKKYGDIWRETRIQNKKELTDMPFTSAIEQITLLAKHVQRIHLALESNELPAKDIPAFTNALTKSLETIQKLSIVDQQMNFSTHKLTAIMEQLTYALVSSGKIPASGDTDVLIGAMEKLVLSLKPPEDEVLTAEIEE